MKTELLLVIKICSPFEDDYEDLNLNIAKGTKLAARVNQPWALADMWELDSVDCIGYFHQLARLDCENLVTVYGGYCVNEALWVASEHFDKSLFEFRLEKYPLNDSVL